MTTKKATELYRQHCGGLLVAVLDIESDATERRCIMCGRDAEPAATGPRCPRCGRSGPSEPGDLDKNWRATCASAAQA